MAVFFDRDVELFRRDKPLACFRFRENDAVC
jgi:hypothetical protein